MASLLLHVTAEWPQPRHNWHCVLTASREWVGCGAYTGLGVKLWGFDMSISMSGMGRCTGLWLVNGTGRLVNCLVNLGITAVLVTPGAAWDFVGCWVGCCFGVGIALVGLGDLDGTAGVPRWGFLGGCLDFCPFFCAWIAQFSRKGRQDWPPSGHHLGSHLGYSLVVAAVHVTTAGGRNVHSLHPVEVATLGLPLCDLLQLV